MTLCEKLGAKQTSCRQVAVWLNAFADIIKTTFLHFRKKVVLYAVLLFPVVPDVLHIVVIFHDLDELFHQLID